MDVRQDLGCRVKKGRGRCREGKWEVKSGWPSLAVHYPVRQLSSESIMIPSNCVDNELSNEAVIQQIISDIK